jgi:hypothetical protein
MVEGCEGSGLAAAGFRGDSGNFEHAPIESVKARAAASMMCFRTIMNDLYP